MLNPKKLAIAVAVTGAFLAAPQVEARVTSITILSTTDAFVDPATGMPRSFGNVGPYEQVRGRFTGELDPSTRQNLVITDINLAQRNANGKVAYTATFTMLKPKDMGRASGVLVYGVSNRGGRALGFGNIGGSATNAGDGFDQKPGHVYLASGWQADLPFNNGAAPAETIQVPVLTGVTGPTFARVVGVSGSTRPLPGAGRTPNITTADAHAGGRLISVEHESNVGVRTGIVEIPQSQWAFADCTSTPFPGVPSSTQICLNGGS